MVLELPENLIQGESSISVHSRQKNKIFFINPEICFLNKGVRNSKNKLGVAIGSKKKKKN
jgi:hypothetical protein